MSDDLSELVAQIKTEFDLGGYFGDYAHIEKATALLDGLAERVRRGDAAIQAATALAEEFAERGEVEHDERGTGEGYAECPKCVSLDILAAIALASESA